jgi:sucrose-6F-phosphate phosphohydrolase
MNPRRLLLCTDMDRTVIPNGTQSEHPKARHRFRTFCQHPDVTLAYVTGRHKTLVQQAIKNYHLPTPDYAITDVGTKIYKIDGHDWNELTSWEQEIKASWRGKSRQQLRELFSHIDELILQESNKQNTHKLSYYLPLFIEKEDIFNNMKKILKDNNVDASLIWSIDEPKNMGLLDILPANATKLHAIEFLQHHLGYQFEETVFAGDSGNDLPVLVSPIQSILVDNASDDIKTTAMTIATEKGNQNTLFIAKPSACGMNANYAAGVLEGVLHYAPNFQDELTTTE